MKPEIILIGGGGHCKACIDVIEQQKRFVIAGIVDNLKKIGEKVLGYPVIACDKNLEEIVSKFKFFLITIGQIKSSEKRIGLFKKITQIKGNFPVIISPRAYVSQHASVAQGTIIMHDAVVNANARIGKNCIINTRAIVEHDAIIKDNCHISTGAIVNGGSVIAEETFFGSGAVAVEGVMILRGSFIKANSLVKRQNE